MTNEQVEVNRLLTNKNNHRKVNNFDAETISLDNTNHTDNNNKEGGVRYQDK